MNHVWNPKSPKVIKVVEDIIHRCRRAERAVALPLMPDAEQVNHWFDEGASVISCGGYLGFMGSGFNALDISL